MSTLDSFLARSLLTLSRKIATKCGHKHFSQSPRRSLGLQESTLSFPDCNKTTSPIVNRQQVALARQSKIDLLSKGQYSCPTPCASKSILQRRSKPLLPIRLWGGNPSSEKVWCFIRIGVICRGLTDTNSPFLVEKWGIYFRQQTHCLRKGNCDHGALITCAIHSCYTIADRSI